MMDSPMECEEESKSVKKKSKKMKDTKMSIQKVSKQSRKKDTQQFTTFDLKDLISSQNIDGSFNTTYFLSHVFLKSVFENLPESVSSLGLDESTSMAIWASVMALAVMEKHLKAKEGEWKLIANKAKSYLKKLKVDVKGLLAEAISLI